MKSFAYLASPDGTDHILKVFTNFEKIPNLMFIGMITTESDVPMKVDATRASAYVEGESERYAADFKVEVVVAGLLLRRVLLGFGGRSR